MSHWNITTLKCVGWVLLDGGRWLWALFRPTSCPTQNLENQGLLHPGLIKICLESTNDSLRYILSMDVGQHQLIIGAPVVYYNSFILLTSFIIQDLHVNFMSTLRQALRDWAIGYFLLANGACRIVFESQLYAIIMYSFALLDQIGKQPQSSVCSLLIGLSQICSSFGLM